TGAGVWIGTGAGTTGNVVAGNYIGTDRSGTTGVPNAVGVRLEPGADATTIGGAAAGAGNLISGNAGAGVSVASSGNTIAGNYVGTNYAGTGSVLPSGVVAWLKGEGDAADNVGGNAGTFVNGATTAP